jgi:O-antigen/teichoic acid export membrane protein
MALPMFRNREARSPALGRAQANVASNAVGLAISVLIQIASVPMYLKGFGPTVYGEWLVLSAVPIYLSLGDMGFASVSCTQATRHFAVGEVAHARRTMRSAWLAVTSISLLVLGLAAILLRFIPFGRLSIRAIPAGDARFILLLLVGYTLVSFQSSFVEGCFRAGGRFPAGTVIASVLRLSEFAAGAVTALWSQDPVALAVALLIARTLGQVIYVLALRRLVPKLTLGYEGAQLAGLRGLVVPGLAFLSLPLGNAFAVQGMVMVTAAELGATAVVTLTTLRLMVNLLRHIADVTSHGVLPEITAALARGEKDQARRLMNMSLTASLLIGGLCLIVLSAAGGQLLTLWTDGEVEASVMLILAMSATVLADFPWRAWSLPLFARNEHHLFCVLYAASYLLAVVVAKFLLSRLGLLAVPLALFITDVALYLPSYRGAKRVLAPPFVKSPPGKYAT